MAIHRIMKSLLETYNKQCVYESDQFSCIGFYILIWPIESYFWKMKMESVLVRLASIFSNMMCVPKGDRLHGFGSGCVCG
jgi:hypothetical protein